MELPAMVAPLLLQGFLVLTYKGRRSIADNY